ncbi:MAG TPA: NAD-dependent epimerase/dehydratase family protein [Gemmatimonadaceae bacterium]|nr:NAD-dependent epimerase/dehydratase family protein [Gemmatimonadaceae bacterium]
MPERARVALVTGGTGFVGSHLVETLVAGGWRVRCLVRKSSVLRWLPTDDVTLIDGDVTSPAGDLDRAVRNVTVVFHLAGVTSAASDETYSAVNVEGTRNVVNAMQRAAPQALLLFCSSLAAAGPSSRRPLNETDEPSPVSAYGKSKLIAERIVMESGLAHLIIRPPAVYGPRDSDILAAFRLARRGLAFRLAPPGQRLSLVHVHDLARGFLCAAEAEGRGVYYMTDGMIHTWEAIIEQVARFVGRPPRVVPVPPGVANAISSIERLRGAVTGAKPLLTPDRIRELSQAEWTCDDTRARLDLDYESSIALPEGIRMTGEWYRSHHWL